MDQPTHTEVGREFVSFAAVGVVGLAADAALFLLLTGGYGWPIAAARSISAACSIATTWMLNRHLTFTTRRSRLWGVELARYAVGQGAGLLVNLGSFTLVLWLIPRLRAAPIVALGIGAGAALLFNFLSARTLAFRPDPR